MEFNAATKASAPAETSMAIPVPPACAYVLSVLMYEPGRPSVYVSTPLLLPSVMMLSRSCATRSHCVGVPSVTSTATQFSPLGELALYCRHWLIIPRSAHSVGVKASAVGVCA